MWIRECDKKKTGHARMVPKLRESHIVRDSWTKLNVAPAKIMQVYSYMHAYICTILLLYSFINSKRRYCLSYICTAIKLLHLKIVPVLN